MAILALKITDNAAFEFDDSDKTDLGDDEYHWQLLNMVGFGSANEEIVCGDEKIRRRRCTIS